jgi:hypothetical protein
MFPEGLQLFPEGLQMFPECLIMFPEGLQMFPEGLRIIIIIDASAYFLSWGWLRNFSPNPLPLPRSAQCDRTHCSHLT